MGIYLLHRRWRTGALAVVEADGPAHAVERASAAGISLAYSDLKGIDAPRRLLTGVDLRGADLEAANLSLADLERADLRTALLTAADLRGASLRRADLRHVDARDADFRGSDLRGADFKGADLRGARVTGARLEGARLDWRRTAFVLELLRRDAGNREGAHRLVAELAFASDERPFGWLETVTRAPALVGWVASVISRAVRPGDGVPDVLRLLAADSLPTAGRQAGDPPEEPSPGFYWTRAVHPRKTPRRSAF